MMERMYAFCDESGAFGWDFKKDGVSSFFVIASIMVKESDVDEMTESLEIIRHKFFQTGEIKSSRVGKNDERRKRIIAEILKLPFNIFAVVVDKRKLDQSSGLRFKKSFYKFMNNILHKELTKAFQYLTIVADEIGGSEYMKSFSRYVSERQDIPNLLGEAAFLFENSKNNLIIQLADFIAGTIARCFEEKGDLSVKPDYLNMLKGKLLRIERYPKEYASYIVEESALAGDYDKEIADICFRQATIFLMENTVTEDDEVRAQRLVLEYLLFRFMNNDSRSYISTKELKNHLKRNGFSELSTQSFRTKVIGKLRDKGVIISSSSPKKGYKIPAKESELCDFINHGTNIIIPMLARLKKCRDVVKLGTNGELDLFDKSEYSKLKNYFDD